MVYTYSGIAKVLWGSLPTERLYNDEKRTMTASQHTLSGFINFKRLIIIIIKTSIIKILGPFDESHLNGPINSSNSLMNPTKSANLIVQENRQKAAKMLISVVIIFAICYIPVHVFNLFR